MNVVLLEPEIPMNTGNVGRSCAATNTPLHLIRPLGFSLDDKYLKRAGMDYWKSLNLREYDSFEEFTRQHPNAAIYMATTKARKNYAEVRYDPGGFLMFGKESAGIPEELLLRYKETAVRIPMLGEIRSLNLASAVAVMLYEALRQQGFPGLETAGQLRRHNWDR